MTTAPFLHRHLLGIEPLSAGDLTLLLDLADRFAEVSERPIKKVPTLRGRTVVNLFFEASTRTRTSFEIAAKRLSADAVNISGSTSSTSKGESLLDTARTVEAMAPDVLVIRHGSSGAPQWLAERLHRTAVVNAGDGMHEHPTQALLDCATIRKHRGRIAGLTVAICGDVAHSRVARSNVHALTKLGATVRVAAPLTLMPRDVASLGAEPFTRIEAAVEGADVVMMLRTQLERLSGAALPNAREYSRYFGLTARILDLAAPDAIVMHPGPMNRGVEIDPMVADGPRAVILQQVTYGVAVRMAVLYLLAGGTAAAHEGAATP
jgi:aspartate carbamoyltransferase catalytic subunit